MPSDLGLPASRRAASEAAAPLAFASRPVRPAASAPGCSPFARLLRGLASELEHGESVTRQALGTAGRSGDLAPADLLALQAGVCRYSEALDLASRLIDRATGSVKTVLQGQ